MKKLFILCIFTLTFFFPGTNGFSDILKEMRDFEESLGEWVKQTDELNQRLSELESEREGREKQIADYSQSMTVIGNLITDLNAKVDKVVQMGSLKGVKDIVKSFEGTLDVFKKRFSQLAKRLEDQEVKTAVLEKIYETAQKPVEILINSIDEQKSVINKLAERLDKQEKLIISMEGSLKKQTSIEELNARLSKLETGVIVQKTEGKKEYDKIPKEVSEIAETGKKVVVSEVPPKKIEIEKKDVTPTVQPKEAKVPAKKVTEANGYTDIGGGFLIKNLKLKTFGSSTRISGEIMNKSDRGYGMIDFKVQAYNEENVFLGGHGFSVYRFKKGETETFEEVITGVEIKEIARYAIYAARMPLVTDTGESTIKMIEKELQVAKADTKDATPEDLEELLFDEGKKGIPEQLEGFKSVGNGFYAGNVSFNSFGSSSSVTGVVKNNSKNDFYNATFIMRIYNKDYGMITSFDFSVRRIKSGEMKTFEEIVAGVNSVDIDSYEIAFKRSY